MIPVTPWLVLDERDIEEVFVQASGPGGQNVNKVATAVQLRFDLARAALPEEVRTRLAGLAGRRVNKSGILVIDARRHRTQERNRADALERLIALVARAAQAPVKRVATRPTLSSRRRRLDDKARRAAVKRQRGAPEDA